MSRGAYRKSLRELEATEDLMGELSSFLSDVADALSESPSDIRVSGSKPARGVRILEGDWPSHQSIAALITQWRAQQKRLREIWSALDENERARLPRPSERSSNRLKPLV